MRTNSLPIISVGVAFCTQSQLPLLWECSKDTSDAQHGSPLLDHPDLPFATTASQISLEGYKVDRKGLAVHSEQLGQQRAQSRNLGLPSRVGTSSTYLRNSSGRPFQSKGVRGCSRGRATVTCRRSQVQPFASPATGTRSQGSEGVRIGTLPSSCPIAKTLQRLALRGHLSWHSCGRAPALHTEGLILEPPAKRGRSLKDQEDPWSGSFIKWQTQPRFHSGVRSMVPTLSASSPSSALPPTMGQP